MPNKLPVTASFDEKAGVERPEPIAEMTKESDDQEAEFDRFLELSADNHRLKVAIAALLGVIQTLQET